MVGHDKRSSKVEFLQGNPEDREKVLVPVVNVYCYYRWDGCSFNSTCTIRVASEWFRLGCDFSLVVSGVLKKKKLLWSGALLKNFLLGYPFHVISCSRFVLYPSVAYILSHFLRLQIVLNPWLMVFSY